MRFICAKRRRLRRHPGPSGVVPCPEGALARRIQYFHFMVGVPACAPDPYSYGPHSRGYPDCRAVAEGASRDRLAIGFNPEAMRDVAGRPSPRGSRRRVLFGSACCAVGGAMFGNQFQGRIFVGTSADALPISVDDPLMTNVLDCIFCHCGSTVRPPARLALA
jgi:hypothetical protein